MSIYLELTDKIVKPVSEAYICLVHCSTLKAREGVKAVTPSAQDDKQLLYVINNCQMYKPITGVADGFQSNY